MLLEAGARGRSDRRRLRPRGDRQRRRPGRRPARDEQRSAVPPGPGPGPGRHGPAAHHAAALRLSEDLRRLRPALHVLRDPEMRGKHVTKPIEEVIGEARELAADGVRELILVAQDTTYYGMDLYGRPAPGRTAPRTGPGRGHRVDSPAVRLPEHFTDELIETLAAAEKIIPYLDMPLQHINDRVLKRMQRRVNRAETEELLAQAARRPSRTWRCGPRSSSASPARPTRSSRSCATSSRDAKFERAGVFTYSLEPDTPAAKLDGHLPEEVKQARRDRLMDVQQESPSTGARRQVGREIEVDRRRPRPGGAEPPPGPRPRRRPGHRLAWSA